MLYFAYGSNLCESRLAGRAPSARFVGAGTLADHELRFHKRGQDGTAKADAVALGPGSEADSGSVVWGALAELTQGDLEILDGFEPGYRRSELPIAIDGELRPAWVYRSLPTHRSPNLRPSDWYLDHILEGGRARGIPQAYLARIAETPSIPQASASSPRRC